MKRITKEMTLVLVLAFLCTLLFAVGLTFNRASTENVYADETLYYLYYDSDKGTYWGGETDTYTTVTSSTKITESGWYYVDTSTTIVGNDFLNNSSLEVNLVIKDDVTLTLDKCYLFYKDLNIYGQSLNHETQGKLAFTNIMDNTSYKYAFMYERNTTFHCINLEIGQYSQAFHQYGDSNFCEIAFYNSKINIDAQESVNNVYTFYAERTNFTFKDCEYNSLVRAPEYEFLIKQGDILIDNTIMKMNTVNTGSRAIIYSPSGKGGKIIIQNGSDVEISKYYCSIAGYDSGSVYARVTVNNSKLFLKTGDTDTSSVFFTLEDVGAFGSDDGTAWTSIPEDKINSYERNYEYFKIEPALPEITIPDVILTYTGENQTPTVTPDPATYKGQELTFKYKLTTSGEYGAMPTFKDANEDGTFVYFEASADGYIAYEGSFKVIVNKADLIDVSVLVQGDAKTFNADEQTPEISASAQSVDGSQVTFLYSKQETGTYSETIPTYIDAGAYKIYYKATAPNHKDATGYVDFSIAKATIENYGVMDWNSVYTDGKPQTVSPYFQAITVGNCEKTLKISSSPSGSFTTDFKLTTPGVETLYYIISAPNHNDTPVGEFDATIAKEMVLYTEYEIKDQVYTGSQIRVVFPTDFTDKNGNPVSAPKAKDGTNVTITYSLTQDGEYSTTIPETTSANVGEYTIYYKMHADNGYYLDYVDGSFDVPIIPKEVTITWSENEFHYNGESHLSEITATWEDVNGDPHDFLVATNDDPVNAGTFEVAAIFKETQTNYEMPEEDTKVYRIIGMTPSLTNAPSGIDGLSYNGNNLQLATAGLAEHGTLMYSIDGKETWSEELPVGKNAQVYTVYYMVKGDFNYEDLTNDDWHFDVTIAKSAPSVGTAPTAKEGLVYNKAAQALANAGTTPDGKYLYSLDGTNWSEEIVTGTNAKEGEDHYTVYYKIEGDANHTDLTNEDWHFDVQIAKATPNLLTAPVGKTGLIYNGEDQELLETLATSDAGTVMYQSRPGTSDYTAGNPKEKWVNNYYISYYIKGDDNYKDKYGFDNVYVSIAPKESAVEAYPVKAENLKYTGLAQDLLTSIGSFEECTHFEFSLDGETWSSTIPTKTNAGTYRVYYIGKATDGQYKDVTNDNWYFDVQIAKVDLTVTAKDKTITYGSAPSNNGVEYAGFVNSETEAVLDGTLQYSYNYEQYINVGNYLIYVQGLTSNNYSIAYVTGTLNVERCSLEITVDKKESKYGDDPVKLTAQVTSGEIFNEDHVYNLSCAVTSTSAVGTYDVICVNDNNNYDVTFKNNTNAYEVKPATLENVSVAQNGDLEFTGANIEPEVTTQATAKNDQVVTFTYSLDESGPYSATMPYAYNADTYTYYYKASADNHDDYQGSFEVFVDKAQLAITISQHDAMTYNGDAQTIQVDVDDAGTLKGGEALSIVYSLEEDGSYTSPLNLMNAGTYTVYFRASANNHKDSTGYFEFVIDKKVIDVEVSAIPKVNKDEELPKATLTIQGIVPQEDDTIRPLVLENVVLDLDNVPKGEAGIYDVQLKVVDGFVLDNYSINLVHNDIKLQVKDVLTNDEVGIMVRDLDPAHKYELEAKIEEPLDKDGNPYVNIHDDSRSVELKVVDDPQSPTPYGGLVTIIIDIPKDIDPDWFELYKVNGADFADIIPEDEYEIDKENGKVIIYDYLPAKYIFNNTRGQVFVKVDDKLIHDGDAIPQFTYTIDGYMGGNDNSPLSEEAIANAIDVITSASNYEINRGIIGLFDITVQFKEGKDCYSVAGFRIHLVSNGVLTVLPKVIDKNGVEVSIDDADSAFDLNITLQVEIKTDINTEDSKEDYSAIEKKYVDANDEIVAVYDVKLMRTIIDEQGNEHVEEIQPKDIKPGTVLIVKMEIPQELQGKALKILHIHSLDDIEMVESEVDGTFIKVKVDRLSQFAFVVQKPMVHGGWCIGWIPVILDILVCFLFIWFILSRRNRLLNIIGLSASIVALIVAIVVICLHVCILSIIGLVGAVILVILFLLFFLKNRKKEDEDKKEEKEPIKDEPKVVDEPAKETKKEELKKEEPVALKQSTKAAAFATHNTRWNKKAVAAYVREAHGDEAETNERPNIISTGLPLADTHYALGDKKKCFVYVYETEGAPLLLINADEYLAEKIAEKHDNIHKSAFPKSKDLWYSLPLDDTYSDEEVKSIIDYCFALAHGGDMNEHKLSLKESLALAKAAKGKHSFTKKKICDYYAKYGDDIVLNSRPNYISTGLPLADTHYVVNDNKQECFVYVYETEGAMILLAKATEEFIEKVAKEHENVNKSAFPKSKNQWYSIVLDDSFTDDDVKQLLDDLYELNKI